MKKRDLLSNLKQSLSNQDEYKLLEEKTINNRTILCWYNSNDNIISISLFNTSEKPNELSRRSPLTNWGYVTYMATNMMTTKEASEVVSLYLKDMESNNFWWERK